MSEAGKFLDLGRERALSRLYSLSFRSVSENCGPESLIRRVSSSSQMPFLFLKPQPTRPFLPLPGADETGSNRSPWKNGIKGCALFWPGYDNMFKSRLTDAGAFLYPSVTNSLPEERLRFRAFLETV